jgi:hypothetical protein
MRRSAAISIQLDDASAKAEVGESINVADWARAGYLM